LPFVLFSGHSHPLVSYAASSSDSDEGEEAVFDIGRAVQDSDDDDSDSDEFESDQKAKPTKVPTGYRKTQAQLSSDEDAEDDEDDDEGESEESDDDAAGLGGGNPSLPKLGWGNRRSTFYNADTGVSIACILK
jgi:hypothetical protein